ncbi:1-acyl-sn-glycerol-3-phosphate acyltransferase [bacterium]|nr:1-acyl-sn-glycerol-3-phosphate acyltransferase [bacterium]
MGSAIRVASNSLRIALCALWTGVVGAALLIAIYPRYWYGLLRARAGRADILDRMLEANAALASWVARDLWTTVLLALTGIRLRVREAVPIDWSRTYVVCANHASLFDIFALIRALPPPYRFVAKRELTRWPIFGWLLRPAGQVIVDRANHAEAMRSVAEAALRRIRGQVVFFVEGTRTRSGELQPFKKGAFHFAVGNRLPVLPAAIRGSFAALARHPWWRLRPGNVIEVLFCAPIDPPPAIAGAAVDSLRDLTRDAIAGGLAG